MNLETICQDCFWCDLCKKNQSCDNFVPIDDSYLEDEYKTDLHMRAKRYQSFVDEMIRDA